MPLSSMIAPHLPHLRRFSRALSGNQESGDAYVVALLEAFIADPSSFDTDVPPRVALYRAFVQMWNSIALNSAPAAHEPSTRAAADRLLTSLTPVPRQAFLLVAMEGLSQAEAAQVLNVTPEEISGLMDTAAREISEELGAEVLIIEDEPMIAIDLEAIVRSLGHRVLAVARTEADAVAAASKLSPSLILADIQLADGSSGLSAARRILATADVPIVFITAYPERLLTGERPEPTFMIAKPFEPDTVKAVISQALFLSPRMRSERDSRMAGAPAQSRTADVATGTA